MKRGGHRSKKISITNQKFRKTFSKEGAPGPRSLP